MTTFKPIGYFERRWTTFKPIGYFERRREYFLVDKKTLDLVKVPEKVFKRWKEVIGKKMKGKV